MTNQEAIDRITGAINLYESSYQTETEYTKAFKVALAALKKQVPKPPAQVEPCNNGLRFGWCPSCPTSHVCETAHYCKTCGQALDWTEGGREKRNEQD